MKEETRHAAELERVTLTDFVVATVQAAAKQTTEQADVVRLSKADQACFAQALLSPPAPAPAWKRAFAHRAKVLRTE